jgi:replication factor C small subunit
LSNADKLTTDAQSALRRCIELFSHSTRFFIIVEDKYKLLKPILSRLCEIFVDEPVIPGSTLRNLYKYHLQQTYPQVAALDSKYRATLKKTLLRVTAAPNKDLILSNTEPELTSTNETELVVTSPDFASLMDLAVKLYDQGYSGLDLIDYVDRWPSSKRKYLLLLAFQKVKREFRNEKMFMAFILFYVFNVRSEPDLENISFI